MSRTPGGTVVQVYIKKRWSVGVSCQQRSKNQQNTNGCTCWPTGLWSVWLPHWRPASFCFSVRVCEAAAVFRIPCWCFPPKRIYAATRCCCPRPQPVSPFSNFFILCRSAVLESLKSLYIGVYSHLMSVGWDQLESSAANRDGTSARRRQFELSPGDSWVYGVISCSYNKPGSLFRRTARWSFYFKLLKWIINSEGNVGSDHTYRSWRLGGMNPELKAGEVLLPAACGCCQKNPMPSTSWGMCRVVISDHSVIYRPRMSRRHADTNAHMLRVHCLTPWALCCSVKFIFIICSWCL